MLLPRPVLMQRPKTGRSNGGPGCKRLAKVRVPCGWSHVTESASRMHTLTSLDVPWTPAWEARQLVEITLMSQSIVLCWPTGAHF